MFPSRSVRLTVLAALVLSLAVFLAPRSLAQPGPLCFNVPGIANCVDGRFREFWEGNGGLPVFGYPVTPATQQTTPEGMFLTQYFERNRFELHPEKARPYDVLLGRLGDDRLQQQGRDWREFPKAAPSAAHYFAETGHAVAHEPFWQYWSTHGLEFDGQVSVSPTEALALFGLPLSEPQTETNTSGDTVLTQWFERARFEDHGPRGVLLGLLGNETRSTPAPVANCNGIGQPQDAVIEPNCVKEGDTLAVLVYGFDAAQEIRYWVARAGSDAPITPVRTARTDRDGEYIQVVNTGGYEGVRLAAGDYTFIARDTANQYRPSLAPFRVIPVGAPPATPVPNPTTPPATAVPTPPVPTATNVPPQPTATTRPPQPTATTNPRAGCDPSYPTICLPPPPPDLDCSDIRERNFPVRPPDPHRLDSNNDGVGCEE